MNEQTFEILENKIKATASRFIYPDTPDLTRVEAIRRSSIYPSSSHLQRRYALALVAVIVLFLVVLTTMAIPSARAAVLEFIQIGVVRIFQNGQSPLPVAPVTATPQLAVTGTPPATPTTRPTPTDLVSILDLEGQTTLDEVRDQVRFPIRLPNYPADLGLPDHVVLQDHGGSVLILIWTRPEEPEHVRLSLHIIEPGSWTVEKVKPVSIQETKVNGQPAIWAVGPYLVRLRNGDLDTRRMVAGNVLIWVEEGLTYRLETDLPLAEAVRIAESLK